MRNKTYELKKRFCELEEQIKLFETGNHSEYDDYDFDDLTDELHRDACSLCSDYVAKVMKLVNNNGKQVLNLKWVKKLAEDIEYLFYTAENLFCWCYDPKVCDLQNEYGNGPIDSIGADFDFPRTEDFEDLHYDYCSAHDYLMEYGLIRG